MEISLESRLISAARTQRSKPAENTENIVPAESKPETDTISITRQAVEKLVEQSERLKNLLEQQSETARPFSIPPAPWETDEEDGMTGDQFEAERQHLKAASRCQEIARRIMRGDKVPPQDERYLMENDPEGYKLVLAMRTVKKHPKKWESVLKDEENQAQYDAGDTGKDAEAVSAGDSTAGSEGGGSTGGGNSEA